jgi:hypothetical protein
VALCCPNCLRRLGRLLQFEIEALLAAAGFDPEQHQGRATASEARGQQGGLYDLEELEVGEQPRQLRPINGESPGPP